MNKNLVKLIYVKSDHCLCLFQVVHIYDTIAHYEDWYPQWSISLR